MSKYPEPYSEFVKSSRATSRPAGSYSGTVKRRQSNLNRIMGRQNDIKIRCIVLWHERTTSGYAEPYSGTVEGRHSTLNRIQGW